VGTRKTKNEELKVRLTDDLKKQYKQYCIENGLDMSKHIREFIEKAVNNK
jgi:antitoxin component of RelBE/YafQ-DinJ toxin-antitoxin module